MAFLASFNTLFAQAVRVFTSAQVGTDPQNGYCLTTNGVTSTWAACATGGGGASSTVIKIGGTISNTGVPTIDFVGGLTVTESPTDEFNITGLAINSVSSSTLDASSWLGGYVLQASSTASGGFVWVATSTLGIVSGSNTVYLSTTTPWTAGQLARVNSNGTVNSVSTSSLAQGTGITISNPGAVVGTGTVTITATLGTDITASEMANSDHGFFSYTSNVASLDTSGLTSANLSGALTNEVGTGPAVFASSTILTAPTLTGTTTATNIDATNIRTTSLTVTATSTLFGYIRCGSGIPPMLEPAVQTLLDCWGSDADGAYAVIGNTNSGGNAYSGLVLNNNDSKSDGSNYGGIFFTSTNYNNTAFGTFPDQPNTLSIENSMGPIQFMSGTTSNSYMAWATNGTNDANERMRLTAAGNLGIGTTSPSARLTIAGDMRLTGRFADSSSSTGSGNNILTATTSGTAWVAPGSLCVLITGSADLCDGNDGGGGGSSHATSSWTVCSLSTCDFVTDGIADEVQINLALNRASSTGGVVQLFAQDYNLSSPILLSGLATEGDGNPEIQLIGMGREATTLVAASNVNAIEIRNRAKYDIRKMSFNIAGTGSGIKGFAGTERGNWQSNIEDIYIVGDFATMASTSWGIDLESPFRMRLANIEMNGVANGADLSAHTDSFNPGNLSIDRMFIDLWDNSANASATGLRIGVASSSSTGVNNFISVNRLDIAGGTNLTNSIGVHILGSISSFGDSRHHTFTNMNIEDVKVAYKLQRARDNTFIDLNYTRVLSGGKVIELDSNSHNNRFENLYAVAQGSGQTFDLITDSNGSSNLPNILTRVDGFQPSSVTINATLAANTILEHVDLSGGSPTIDSDITNRNNTRTFQDVLVTDEAYGVGWNGSLEVPTKNALYDKIETIGGGASNWTDGGTFLTPLTSTDGILLTGSSTIMALRTSALRDSTNSLGSIGQVLQSNGATAQWVSTSTLGLTGGGTVTGVESVSGVGTRIEDGVSGGNAIRIRRIVDTSTVDVGLDGDGAITLDVIGGGGGGSSGWSTTTLPDGALAYYPSTPTVDLLLGGNSTATAGFWYDHSASSTRFGNGGTGDSVLELAVNSVTQWVFGADSSANNDFVFSRGTSLGANNILTFHATGTKLRHSSNLSGFSQATGLHTAFNTGTHYGRSDYLDELVVAGRVRQIGWVTADCLVPYQGFQITADLSMVCGPYQFIEDSAGTLTATANAGYAFGRLALATTINDGAGIFLHGPTTGWMRFGTTTPSFEAVARVASPSTWGTSSFAIIGYGNVDPTGTSIEVAPTSGCYFTASSTIANWFATCANASNRSFVDTTIASTTAVGTGATNFIRFRIDADADGARFFMQTTEADTLTEVGYIASSSPAYPSAVNVGFGVYLGRGAATNSPVLDILEIKGAYRRFLPSR